MTKVTIEAVRAKQTELNAMITKLVEQASQERQIKIEARTIKLCPGERYAGAKLHSDGSFSHDVIVLAARTDDDYSFQGAQEWAKANGGDAPSPEECALIKANCPEVLTKSWVWTNRPHAENASYAWYFYSHGDCYYNHKSAQGGALAVRLIPITA